MKVYKIDFSFDNNEPVFGAKENFKIENSKFTKEEIVDFLNWIDINDFSLMDEIKMRERRNMSISNLMTEDKISELPDMMYIAGFGETILLSEKAKEYIPKNIRIKILNI